MTIKRQDIRINKVVTKLTVEWGDLKEIIGDGVRRIERNLPPFGPGVSYKISIEQQSEGSPSYYVQKWVARIIVEQEIDP